MKKLLLAACVLLPATAHADGPDVFGGYAFSRRDGDSYHGVRAGLDFGLTRTLGLEVAAAAQRTPSYGGHYTDIGLMAGPRFHGSGRRAPFLALTAGFVRTSQDVEGDDFFFSDVYTEPTAAVDVGVDLTVGERWAVRIQAGIVGTRDYDQQGDFVEKNWQANPRGSAAIVWRPGR
jgi:hypothetical protein